MQCLWEESPQGQNNTARSQTQGKWLTTVDSGCQGPSAPTHKYLLTESLGWHAPPTTCSCRLHRRLCFPSLLFSVLPSHLGDVSSWSLGPWFLSSPIPPLNVMVQSDDPVQSGPFQMPLAVFSLISAIMSFSSTIPRSGHRSSVYELPRSLSKPSC